MDNKLERKSFVVDHIAKQAEPPLALLEVPADPLEREKIGEQLWNASLMVFDSRLSDREKKVWHNPPPADAKLSLDEMRRRYPDNMRLLNSFHDFILHQLGEYPLLLLSRGMMQQIVNWQRNGQVDLCNRVGSELAHWSNVFAGNKSAAIPDDADVWAESIIAELERLLRRVRDEFGARAVAPTAARIAAFVAYETQDESKGYPLLRVERAKLCGWIETLPARNRDAAAELLRGEMTANDLFFLWYSDSLNRNPKDVRNLISKLRVSRRRS